MQNQQQDVIDYGINQTYTETRNNYETIRFRFVLEPILSEMGTGFDDKIKSIINEILPAVETMWSQHLAVFPVQGNIPVYHNACFGVFQEIIPDSDLNDVTDADLVVLVHGKDILTFPTGETINLCKGTAALAVAAVCSLSFALHRREGKQEAHFTLKLFEEHRQPRAVFHQSACRPVAAPRRRSSK